MDGRASSTTPGRPYERVGRERFCDFEFSRSGCAGTKTPKLAVGHIAHKCCRPTFLYGYANVLSQANEFILYYGKDEPLPEQIPLRAGPLTMVYENGDLRTIRLDKHEVVRRIYAAARDRGWGTAPNVLSEVRMDVREDSFEIVYTCENKLNDLHFVWHGRLAGRADGSLVCEFDGVAQSTFLRNRLGFCVLHPIGMAGKQAHIERVDGTVVDSRFPKRIAPQRIVGGQIKPVPGFDEMRAITCDIETGVRVRIAFEGDIFEMEDQRNWTDGSYKTYCTPLRLPFPIEVKEGERIRQTIALAVEGGGRKAANGKRQTSKQEIEFTLLNSQVAMPLLGMSVSANGKPINKKETTRLKALKLAHVRVDVALWEKDWRTHLARAARQATLLGTKLEIALFVSEDAAKELSQFVAATKTTKLSVARYLVHHHKEQATSAKWIALARQHLGKRVVIFSGTNLFFTELNRNRPDAKTLELLNGLCYSFNPQVHAIDNTSLAEAPEAQAETVRTCATFAKGKPLAIGAITLKPRWSLGNPGQNPARRPVSSTHVRCRCLAQAGLWRR